MSLAATEICIRVWISLHGVCFKRRADKTLVRENQVQSTSQNDVGMLVLFRSCSKKEPVMTGWEGGSVSFWEGCTRD